MRIMPPHSRGRDARAAVCGRDTSRRGGSSVRKKTCCAENERGERLGIFRRRQIMVWISARNVGETSSSASRLSIHGCVAFSAAEFFCATITFPRFAENFCAEDSAAILSVPSFTSSLMTTMISAVQPATLSSARRMRRGFVAGDDANGNGRCFFPRSCVGSIWVSDVRILRAVCPSCKKIRRDNLLALSARRRHIARRIYAGISVQGLGFGQTLPRAAFPRRADGGDQRPFHAAVAPDGHVRL